MIIIYFFPCIWLKWDTGLFCLLWSVYISWKFHDLDLHCSAFPISQLVTDGIRLVPVSVCNVMLEISCAIIGLIAVPMLSYSWYLLNSNLHSLGLSVDSWIVLIFINWGFSKMATILQTAFLNVIKKIYVFVFILHWSLFLEMKLIICHHGFRLWYGTEQKTSHYLHQWWSRSTTIPYIDGLVQERHNSIANAMELRLSCTNPLIYSITRPQWINDKPVLF